MRERTASHRSSGSAAATRFLLAAILFPWAVIGGGDSGSLRAKYPVRLQEPLKYGREFVEVTADNTLRRRYRVWGDWEAEVKACLEVARANAAERETPARRVKMGCVFLKDARITFPKIPGSDGKPLEGTFTTPRSFVEAMKARGMRDYSDFMFAFSGGELEVEWVTETLAGLHWAMDADRTPAWGCQPRAVGGPFLKALEQYRDAGVSMWMLCAGRPVTLNGGPKQRIGAPPYGISYTQWPIHGGYSLVISGPDVGLMVHEFNHRYLDNLIALEGIQLTMFHGLGNLGYGDTDVGYPRLLNTYRSVYQYLIRRDMWRRFSITTSNAMPREAFSGRAYAWADVQSDCWFRLPELGDPELAKLTGIPSFRMDAQKAKTYRHYKVDAADRARVLSPYADAPSEEDTALNNLLSLRTETAAVLKTATGHWLFVRPDLADVYVDMFQTAGVSGKPLDAVGYVLEGVRPLLVLRAPPDLRVPENELGYFRKKGIR